MIQVDGVWIVSAGDTFFSNSLANAAMFVFRRDPYAFARVHGSGPSGGPAHPSCLHSALSYQDHLAGEVSVCLQNEILAFYSGCLCADC